MSSVCKSWMPNYPDNGHDGIDVRDDSVILGASAKRGGKPMIVAFDWSNPPEVTNSRIHQAAFTSHSHSITGHKRRFLTNGRSMDLFEDQPSSLSPSLILRVTTLGDTPMHSECRLHPNSRAIFIGYSHGYKQNCRFDDCLVYLPNKSFVHVLFGYGGKVHRCSLVWSQEYGLQLIKKWIKRLPQYLQEEQKNHKPRNRNGGNGQTRHTNQNGNGNGNGARKVNGKKKGRRRKRRRTA